MTFGSHLKSVAKAVSWRLLGAADTFVLSFLVTGHAGAAAGIVGLEVLTKTASTTSTKERGKFPGSPSCLLEVLPMLDLVLTVAAFSTVFALLFV